MSAGRARRRTRAFVFVLALVVAARAHAAEVRVLSGPGAATTVTIEAMPGVTIEDRTPGAKPSTGAQGPASGGQTFGGELTLFLRGLSLARVAAIEVDDPVVSVVRLFPEADGTAVTIFIRQPVTYAVAPPSATGEIRIELHGRARPVTVTGVTETGKVRFARPKPTNEKEVSVDAETLSFDQATNTLTARGDVTVTRQDMTLTADEVVYDRTNGVIEARGHVVLNDPEATVDGDFAHLNLEDETGWMEDATADMHVSRYIVRGDRIEKLGGPRYSVADGVFTTCRCGGIEKPSWSILGTHTNVTVQGAGVVQGMVLHVKDVPVLWFPYMIFPANTQRQSGFLFPRLGYSNKRGFQYEQPFFWAIDKSSDATLALDLETNVRVGGIGEYRYVLSPGAHGAFTASYFNESWRSQTNVPIAPDGLPTTVPTNRFGVFGRHVQPFYGDSRFYLDVFAVSDNVFLKEINTFSQTGTLENVALRTERFTKNDAGVYKGWGDGYANLETAWFQDLVDPPKLAPQRLPRLDAVHSVSLLDDHVVAGFAGQAIDYQRVQANGGLRADLAPDLFVPFNVGRYLAGSVTGQVREIAYHLTDREQVALAVPLAPISPKAGPVRSGFVPAPELPQLAADRATELAQVNGRLGTEFDRIFDFHHFGLEKLKHTIEPEVQYLYMPAVSRPFDSLNTTIDCGSLPGGTRGARCPVTLFGAGYLFDAHDAYNRRNFFSYGVTSRLLGRGPLPAAPAIPPGDIGAASGATPEAMGPDFVGPPAPSEFVGPPPPPPPPPAAPPTTAARELLRASILQGRDLTRPLVGDSHQSDVDLGLRVSPVDYLAFASNATVGTEQASVRGVTFSLLGRDPWWKPQPGPVASLQSAAGAVLSYRFVEQDVNRNVASAGPEAVALSTAGVNEIDGGLYLPLGSYLGFAFVSRYSFDDADVISSKGVVETGPNGAPLLTGPHFLERDYLLRIISRCNCWVLEAGFADKFNPDERLFRVQFTLVGLGSFGQDPLRNYVALAPLQAFGLLPQRSGFGGLY
jgi:LPS-assembly protein